VSRREDGIDAIRQLSRLLDRVDDDLFTCTKDARLPFLPRVVVGQVAGGTAPGRTANLAWARGDVRIGPGMSGTSVLRDLQRLIREAQTETPELRATARILLAQTPFAVDERARVVDIVRDAHARVTGRLPRTSTALPAGAYVTDAADIVRVGIPAVVYGPCDWRQVADERARVADLTLAARVYALSALAVCGAPANARPPAAV
jgi:acetylornithine deacetylase/succinyl-diaminopimelate desuccinylase-like protein